MNTKNVAPIHVATALAGALGLAACAETATVASITSAAERRDIAYLDGVCSSKIHAEYDEEHLACVKRDAARLAASTCQDVIRLFNDQRTNSVPEIIEIAATKLADCGHWAYIFERHWGNKNEGVTVLQRLEAAKRPIEAELVKYLASHAGAKYFLPSGDKPSVAGLEQTILWLTGAQHSPHCAEFAAAATGSNDYVRAATLRYFEKAKCAEGVSLAAAFLSHSEPTARKLACETLGSIGDPTVIDKVEAVAKNDLYAEAHDELQGRREVVVTGFPVRDACREATEKLRGAPRRESPVRLGR
jgi:hypothetical protein